MINHFCIYHQAQAPIMPARVVKTKTKTVNPDIQRALAARAVRAQQRKSRRS